MSSRRPILLVMAKSPRLGVGKTRLAAGVGRVAALRINRMMQARILRALAHDPRWRTHLLVAPDADVARQAPGVWPAGLARAPQGRGDLGARLARAFTRYGRALVAVVGVDCPDQTPARVARALAAARRHRAAIGPTMDGGFWVLAVRHAARAAQAFAHVRWSTPHACADMIAGLDTCGVGRPVRVDTLRDVDDADDWRAVSQRAAYRAARSIGR